VGARDRGVGSPTCLEQLPRRFGNVCGRVNALAGVSQVRFHSASVIWAARRVNWSAWQLTTCPETLQFPAAQPLLRSRQ
jgi:hypothetical protein